MVLSSLLLFLAILIVVSLIVAQPLIEGSEGENSSQGKQSHWLAERERALDALAELDMDWQLGKIPDEIYGPQRRALVAKGAKAIEELEKPSRKQKDDELEKIITAYKRKVRK